MLVVRAGLFPAATIGVSHYCLPILRLCSRVQILNSCWVSMDSRCSLLLQSFCDGSVAMLQPSANLLHRLFPLGKTRHKGTKTHVDRFRGYSASTGSSEPSQKHCFTSPPQLHLALPAPGRGCLRRLPRHRHGAPFGTGSSGRHFVTFTSAVTAKGWARLLEPVYLNLQPRMPSALATVSATNSESTRRKLHC